MAEALLILYVHGSEDPHWRHPFELLEADLQRDAGEDRVRLAYMEFAEPTLLQVAAEAFRDGRRRLVILPVFLAAGAHLSTDLPEQVTAVKGNFRKIEVTVLPPVGEDPRLLALLRVIAYESIADPEQQLTAKDFD